MSNASYKPLLLVLSTLFILFVFSIFIEFIEVPTTKIKVVDIAKDIKVIPYTNTATLVHKVEPIVTQDSIIVPDYTISSDIISYEPVSVLRAFVNDLRELNQKKRKKVRIAYFGDSMIEGDLISQDLRAFLQEYFGGTGVGFVPITSITSGFRSTISHQYSNNWIDHSFVNPRQMKKEDIFLSGHTFTPNGTATVKYKAVNKPHLNKFEECYLLYGQMDSSNVFMVNQQNFYSLTHHLVNKLLVASDTNSIHASFSGHGSYYGFSFESEEGVFVDNYSFRGISGKELLTCDGNMLQALNEVHTYDLIILQYGPNLLFNPELRNFDWYAITMTKVVNKLKKVFPEASILIISSADKSFRYDGDYKTALGVIPLIKVQHLAAKNTGVAFWNLYNAMGGENSMIQWVNSSPPLANTDYTHFNHKGAAKIGGMLFKQLMKLYESETSTKKDNAHFNSVDDRGVHSK